MLFRFKNSKGEFLKNISPVTYTNDESAAYVADLDLACYDTDDVENKLTLAFLGKGKLLFSFFNKAAPSDSTLFTKSIPYSVISSVDLKSDL